MLLLTYRNWRFLLLANWLHRFRRSERTLLSDLSTVEIKCDRDRDEAERDEAEECACPVHVQRCEHVLGEHGEAGSSERSHESVSSDGGSGEHEVSVDEVVERLKENGKEAEAGEETGEGWDDPMD